MLNDKLNVNARISVGAWWKMKMTKKLRPARNSQADERRGLDLRWIEMTSN
jgi:hypothetical protein